MEDGIFEVRASLFRDAHFQRELTRLFYNWISACKLYKLFRGREISDISNFSKKHSSKFFRNTLNGGDAVKLREFFFFGFLPEAIVQVF